MIFLVNGFHYVRTSFLETFSCYSWLPCVNFSSWQYLHVTLEMKSFPVVLYCFLCLCWKVFRLVLTCDITGAEQSVFCWRRNSCFPSACSSVQASFPVAKETVTILLRNGCIIFVILRPFHSQVNKICLCFQTFQIRNEYTLGPSPQIFSWHCTVAWSESVPSPNYAGNIPYWFSELDSTLCYSNVKLEYFLWWQQRVINSCRPDQKIGQN